MQQAGYFSRDMKAREPQKGRPRRNRDMKPMDSEQLFQYISGGDGMWLVNRYTNVLTMAHMAYNGVKIMRS